MSDEATKHEWLLRVLGIGVDQPRGGKRKGGYLAIWREAKEDVDAAIAALAGRLRATGDPDLERIAEFGLYGLTDGEGVKLMAALREVEANPSGAGAKLAKAIDTYRAFLAQSEVVTLIDSNPFGVTVSMRATLGRALNELQQQLAA